MSTPENIRRDARSSAVKELNRLAATIGEDAISTRASSAKVQRLYETLCEQLDEAALGDLALARREWADNGGGGDLRSEQGFRLQARAFMPTFNSITFTLGLELGTFVIDLGEAEGDCVQRVGVERDPRRMPSC